MNQNKEFCTKQENEQFQDDKTCPCGGCDMSSVSQEKNSDTINDIKSRKYDLHEIENGSKLNNSLIFSSSISKNEQYLVYNIDDGLKVYNLKMKRTQKSIYQKNGLSQIQFTIDSKYLFAGDFKGFVYGHLVQNGFKTFYQQKIHLNRITQIIIQAQYLITASYDTKIIKTNFTNKQLIFQLVGHSYRINSIDYDIEKDVIISASGDETIKIWDCSKQSVLIEQRHQDNYERIYIIDNKQDLLCSNVECYLWIIKIDYQNKKLVKLYVYQDENDILTFQQVNIDQRLVICRLYCKILNNQGKLIHKIQHGIDLKGNKLSCQQKYFIQLIDNNWRIQIILFYKIVNYFIILKCTRYISYKLRSRNEILIKTKFQFMIRLQILFRKIQREFDIIMTVFEQKKKIEKSSQQIVCSQLELISSEHQLSDEDVPFQKNIVTKEFQQQKKKMKNEEQVLVVSLLYKSIFHDTFLIIKGVNILYHLWEIGLEPQLTNQILAQIKELQSQVRIKLGFETQIIYQSLYGFSITEILQQKI